MGKVGNKYWRIGIFSLATVAILVQFQNCGPQQMSSGLTIGRSASSDVTAGNPAFNSASCQTSGCGSIDYVYWDSCVAKVSGWAWSNDSMSTKTVSLHAENNSSTVTTSDNSRSDIYSSFPYMNGSTIGFKANLPYKGDYVSSDLAFTGSVQGTNGANAIASNHSYPPTDCWASGGNVRPVANCNTGSAFGWIDTATWDGSGTFVTLANKVTNTPIGNSATCSLKINGWGWTKASGNASKVRIILDDGTYRDVLTNVSYPAARNLYYPNYTCMDDSPGFLADFGVKTFSKTGRAQATNGAYLVTVTGIIYGTGVLQPMDSLYIEVPLNCVQ